MIAPPPADRQPVTFPVTLVERGPDGAGGATLVYACAQLSATWSWADALAEWLSKAPAAERGPWREAVDVALAIALGPIARSRGIALEVALSERTAPEAFQALDALGVTVERWGVAVTPSEVLQHGRARGPLLRDLVPMAFSHASHVLLEACGPFDALVCGDVLGPLSDVAGAQLRAQRSSAEVVRVIPSANAYWLSGLASPWRPPGPGARAPLREIAVTDRAAAEAQRRVARSSGLLLDLASAATVHAARSVAASLPADRTVVAIISGAGEREFSVSEALLK